MAGEKWRKCPQCGAWSFYVDIPGSKLIVFRISQERAISFTYHDRTTDITDETKIHCMSCAWYGTTAELD